MTEERFAKAGNGAWIEIAGNIGLALMKGIVGWFSGSKALIADAFHTASNVACSIAALIGLKHSRKPADKDRPYAGGNAETVSAIVVSMLLMLVGLEIAIASVKAMMEGVDKAPTGYAVGAIVISLIVKAAMVQYQSRVGKKASNRASAANAWERSSDVYSSLAALFGAAGAMLGDKLDVAFLLYLDPAAGLIVTLLILRMGYRLITDTIFGPTDQPLHDDQAAEFIETVQRVGGVIAVDELRARELGHYVVIDVKISVNPRLSVMEGHDIGKRVKHQLMQRHLHVSDVFIQVNPYDPGYPYKTNHQWDEDDMPTLLQ
ncbi:MULTISPECIES: cation diffusion facilitator family transporter [unclassified Paenibacillus]|uniref:cation diffusion facilitator family transporter n=1 Tax=unclassified Paenibacillus TaxID=185978 RepID=UPI001C11BE84|nr:MULTISPECIES: cation diffusion facilitator family transporter [unclassified Paenibacillus]MBU5442640.1 cation diffusion facilitator family transporter [Paenibacillus sp. MSJ-34]CAH0119093.1 Manganese efflux system protein MneP [Paenibacillus sp. CECT 9249]